MQQQLVLRSIPCTRGSTLLLVLLLTTLALPSAAVAQDNATGDANPSAASDSPFVVVLGVGQDAGIPQAGSHDHPAWTDPSLARMATSIGLVEPRSGRRWLFDATPDLRQQLYDLDRAAQQSHAPFAGGFNQSTAVLNGVFITHAHIGHYAGLMFLGHESMGAFDIPVHVMPRMQSYLEGNGPWDQLVRYRNVELQTLEAGSGVSLASQLLVTPLPVPHRQEYAEVVGFRIDGPERSALYLPDIDSWHELDSLGVAIEAWIAAVDIAFLDGTFFANGEIPGRDMSGFPHPFIRHSMQRFAPLPASERNKIHFIHFNHTNPAGRPDTPEAGAVREAGFHLARQGDRFAL